MRVVYVTSSVTYVKDNYLHLFERICDKKRLPQGVEVAEVVFIQIPTPYVLKNAFGLMALGAPQVGFALLRNLTSSLYNDKRLEVLKKEGIPLYRCKNINHEASLAHLRETKPDLIVNARTRNIYKEPVLKLPTVGCINIHHGLLPDNRGTMCDLWAWTQKRPVGFTIHWMNAKIDDGDILERHPIDVTTARNYVDITYLSSQLECQALVQVLKKIVKSGAYVGTPNKTPTPVKHTKNPTPSQILEMRRNGFSL